MCFHSSVWAKGEGLEERLRAKKQPLGDLSTLSSWGGGCSPIPPQIREWPKFPSQLRAQISGLPITARCVPVAGFSQLPYILFSFPASSGISPHPG